MTMTTHPPHADTNGARSPSIAAPRPPNFNEQLLTSLRKLTTRIAALIEVEEEGLLSDCPPPN